MVVDSIEYNRLNKQVHEISRVLESGDSKLYIELLLKIKKNLLREKQYYHDLIFNGHIRHLQNELKKDNIDPLFKQELTIKLYKNQGSLYTIKEDYKTTKKIQKLAKNKIIDSESDSDEPVDVDEPKCH